MQLGPVRFKVDAKHQAALNAFNHRLIIRETDFNQGDDSDKLPIQELYSALAADQRRNDLIIKDVIASLDDRHSPIVLSERKDHLDYLYAKLKGFAKNIVMLRAGRSAREQWTVEKQLHAIAPDEERLLLTTGRCIGEGFAMVRIWIPCFSRVRSPGVEFFCNMPDDCTTRTRTSTRLEFWITSIRT